MNRRTLSGRTRRSAILAGLLLTAGLLLPACSRETKTVREVKEDFAIAMLDGFSEGFLDIKAQSYDKETLELIDVSLYDGQRMMHADRAEIVVDPDTNTAMIRLIGVVGVNTEGGTLIEMPGFVTDKIRLPYKVVSAP